MRTNIDIDDELLEGGAILEVVLAEAGLGARDIPEEAAGSWYSSAKYPCPAK